MIFVGRPVLGSSLVVSEGFPAVLRWLSGTFPGGLLVLALWIVVFGLDQVNKHVLCQVGRQRPSKGFLARYLSLGVLVLQGCSSTYRFSSEDSSSRSAKWGLM